MLESGCQVLEMISLLLVQNIEITTTNYLPHPTIGASIKHLDIFEDKIIRIKVKCWDLFSCFGLRLVKCWYYLMPMIIFLRSEPLVTFNTKPKHTLIYWYRLHYNTSLSSFGFIKNFQQSQANKNSTQIPDFVLWTIFVY